MTFLRTVLTASAAAQWSGAVATILVGRVAPWVVDRFPLLGPTCLLLLAGAGTTTIVRALHGDREAMDHAYQVGYLRGWWRGRGESDGQDRGQTHRPGRHARKAQVIPLRETGTSTDPLHMR